MWEAVDDAPASHDGDTTCIEKNGNGSSFVLLSNTPADFDPAGINSITLDFVAREVVGTGVEQVFTQVFKSDEATALTNESAPGAGALGFGRVQSAVAQQGFPTKADWDGARLRIRHNVISGDNKTRCTAARVIIDYTPGIGFDVGSIPVGF